MFGMSDPSTDRPFEAISRALGRDPAPPGSEADAAGLPAWFDVSGLACACVRAAGLEIAALAGAAGGSVRVDRRLASFWFGWTLRPEGWSTPAAWDPLAGDYPCGDGWVRLHTNAPRHRQAALDVLGTPAQRAAVAAALLNWSGEAVEEAVAAAGGCAAVMRSEASWASHPQGRAVGREPLIAWSQPPPAGPTGAAAAGGRPLAGLRVLDLTRVLAGPVATRFLAAYGADVLRIDPPDWDEPGVVPEVSVGKRCAGLDLTRADDRAVFTALLSRADVLVHGYRPGALAGLGFSEDERRMLNPRLIDVTLNAYGWTGPLAGRRGFDSLVQMSAGLAHTGMIREGSDRPAPLPVQALDHATGYLMAAAVVRAVGLVRSGGPALSAKLSLARTAALLLAAPLPVRAQPFARETAGDLADGLETTAWGPARRLRFPVIAPGVEARFDRPATPLRSAPAAWIETTG